MTKTYKQKTCKQCEETFTPERQFQNTCSFDCAIQRGKDRAKTEIKRDKRKAVKAFKQSDKSHLMKIAQQTFNKYIRLRDKNEPCISCGHTGSRQRHAGHFMPVGSNGHIRFDEANCHSQCSICNNHKSGNLSEYESNLIFKIGLIEVERLKQKFTKSWTIDELKEIIDTYKQKIKEM